MDTFKFLKQWAAIMIIVMLTMAIIGFSMRIVFKQKEISPVETEMAGQITEDVLADAMEISLVYMDNKYSVDRRAKQWHIDTT